MKCASRSKTLRFNLAVKVAAIFFGTLMLYFPQLEQALPSWAYVIAIVVITTINEALRLVTREPVTVARSLSNDEGADD